MFLAKAVTDTPVTAGTGPTADHELWAITTNSRLRSQHTSGYFEYKQGLYSDSSTVSIENPGLLSFVKKTISSPL